MPVSFRAGAGSGEVGGRLLGQALQGGGHQAADGGQVIGGHVAGEAAGVFGAEHQDAEGMDGALGTQGHAGHGLRGGVQPFPGGAVLSRAAIGGCQGAGIVFQGIAHFLNEGGRADLVPHAQHHGRHFENALQAFDHQRRQGLGVVFGEHVAAPLHQLLGNALIAAGVVKQAGQLPFQFLAAVAQGEYLPLAKRDGAGFVRMGYPQVGKDVGVFLEEFRIRLQEDGDLLGSGARAAHGTVTSLCWDQSCMCAACCRTSASMSTVPWNTVTAGPVMCRMPSCQAISSTPPRVWTRTGESRTPRRMPATAAAQAPVPQARVSPAPRSYTRRRTECRSTTSMKPTFTRWAKRSCDSMKGPHCSTGAVATSSTTMTACGLEMPTSDRRAC